MNDNYKTSNLKEQIKLFAFLAVIPVVLSCTPQEEVLGYSEQGTLPIRTDFNLAQKNFTKTVEFDLKTLPLHGKRDIQIGLAFIKLSFYSKDKEDTKKDSEMFDALACLNQDEDSPHKREIIFNLLLEKKTANGWITDYKIDNAEGDFESMVLDHYYVGFLIADLDDGRYRVTVTSVKVDEIFHQLKPKLQITYWYERKY